MPQFPHSRLLARVAAPVLGLALLAPCAPSFAAAQSLRPGLWDYALQTRNGSGPPMNLAQMLRSLPPSARPQVEARLRAQGMALSPDGGLQICLDNASLAAGHPPLHLSGRCDVHWKHGDPADWSFHYACQSPDVQGQGSLHIASPTAYSSAYTVSGPHGSVSGQAKAHWVATSCGGVPPLRSAR